MGAQSSTAMIFDIIHATLMADNNVLTASTLFKIAGVSSSGYYAHCKNTGKREVREQQDRTDFDPVYSSELIKIATNGADALFVAISFFHPLGEFQKLSKNVIL
jgi:hypothetical protein